MTKDKDTTFRQVREGLPIGLFMEKTVEALKPYMSEGASLEVTNMTLFYSDEHELCVDTEHYLPTLALKTTRKN